MYRNTGNFTFATIDYYYENIFGRLDDPNMPKMTALIDPYEYRERFVMPKLIISSTGDEFFMPDDRNGCTCTLSAPLSALSSAHSSAHSSALSGALWISHHSLKVITISKIYLNQNISVC